MDTYVGAAALFPLLLEGTFYITAIIFTIYTLFLVYHWYGYGTDKTTPTVALAVFLLGSAPLFIVMTFALRAI